MAGKSDIQAGKAAVLLTLNDSAFIKGLASARKRLESAGASITGFGVKIAALGAAASAPFVGAIKHFVDFGGAMDDMSARTGVSRESLVELGYAAEQSGGSIADIETAIRRTQKSLKDANDGSKEMSATFQELGLSAATLKGMAPDKQFDAVAVAIGKVADPSKRAALAMEIFGRSGTKLLPMLGSLQELKNEARQLGIVPSEASMKLADALGDSFGKVQRVVGAVFYEIGAALAPVILPMVDGVAQMGKAFIDFIKANQGTIQVVAGLAFGILTLGTVIMGVGGTLTMLGMALGGISTTITALAPLFAALVSPIGLVTIGIAAGVAAWMRWTTSGQNAAKWVGEAFARFGEIASQTFGGVVDAMMAGDLALAGRVAIGGLMVVWHEATQDVVRLWANVKWGFLQTWTEATYGLASLFTDAFAGVQKGWVMTVAAMQSAWNSFSTSMANGWNQSQKQAGSMAYTIAVTMGLMSQEAADIANETLSNNMDQKIEQRTLDAGAEKQRIATTLGSDLASIEANRQGAQANIASGRQAETDANQAAWQKTIDDKRKAVEDARTEFEAARAKADLARTEREAAMNAKLGGINPGEGPGGTDGGPPGMPGGSAGTFSAAGAVAAFGSSGGSVPEKTLEEMKAIRKLMAEDKKMKDRYHNAQLKERALNNIRFEAGTT